MAISKAKKLSPAKVLFLSLLMVGGEIGSDVVKMLKKDYGDNYIKTNVIYPLVHNGYVTKTGYRSQYGYLLTEKGYEYLETKYPDNYNYSLYKYSEAYLYKENVKARNRRLSLVLYSLYREGIEYGTRYEDAYNIINGTKKVNVTQPFFVTCKEIKTINDRLKITVGSRFYGCIFTSEGITVVYAPDAEHQLNMGFEDKAYNTLVTTLKNSYAPYNDKTNLSSLFLFENVNSIVSSYEVKQNQISQRSSSTRRVFLKNKFTNNYLALFNDNSFRISDILYSANKNIIDNVFIDYYSLDSYRLTPDTTFVDGVYEGKLAVLLWNLNPTKIAYLMKYINKTSEKVLVCCYTEQISIIDKVLSINSKVHNHTVIAGLPKDDVNAYINGEISEIE